MKSKAFKTLKSVVITMIGSATNMAPQAMATPAVKEFLVKQKNACSLIASLIVVMAIMVFPNQSRAADDSAELAKKLSNPVAALISVPMKLDWDTGIGPKDADRSVYIVQPVIPISLNEEWNVISRTILPVYIDMESPAPGVGNESGGGDILQSFFFSPKAPTASGWIWGVGPAISLPTASEDELGTEKYSAGPTAVVLSQQNGWTYGALANHLWSVAGEDNRADVSASFVQPFVSFTTKTFTTFGLNTESTYDWEVEQWVVPVNLTVAQLVKLGNQPVSFLLGYRNYVDVPKGGPDWGVRFQVTLLFPK